MTDKLKPLVDAATVLYAGIDKTKFVPVNKESPFILRSEECKGHKTSVVLYLQDLEKKINITIHLEENKND